MNPTTARRIPLPENVPTRGVLTSARVASLACSAVIALAGCLRDDTVEGTGTPSAGDGPASEPQDATGPQCNEAHDGESACGTTMCLGGTFCRGGSYCENGCKHTSNCMRGQYCDKSTARFDVGTCRACNRTPGGSTCSTKCREKAGACGDPNASALCADLCAQGPTAEQIVCLESTPCATLAKGGAVCGLRIEGSGGATGESGVQFRESREED